MAIRYLRHILIAVAISAVMFQAVRLFYHFGSRTVAYSHYPGPCVHVPRINNGSEDIAMMKDGRAFVSTGNGYAARGFDRSGGIHLIHLNQEIDGDDIVSTELKITGDFPHSVYFQPLGLGLWEDPDSNRIFLFSIILRSGPSDVAIFEFDHVDTLMFRSSVSSDVLGLGFMNDVQPTGPSSFYVSEFTRTPSYNPTLFMAEINMMLPITRVVHWDGERARVVADRIKGANGLAMSGDGETLYVSAAIDKALLIYERGPDNSLRFVYRAFLDSMADNLFFDPRSGSVWIGAHPILGEFIKHESDYDYPSPSHVLRVTFQRDDAGQISRHEIHDIFSDSGRMISGASSAVLFDNKLLIGSVAHKMLLCDIVYM